MSDGAARTGTAITEEGGRRHTEERAAAGGAGGENAITEPGDEDGGGWVGSLQRVDPDRYELGAEIARGGGGRIVAARDRRLSRKVALKVPLVADGEAGRRFEREALVTARLQHPGIVPVYEAGRLPTGESFYAMKLVAGRSLRDAIAELATARDRMALLPQLIAVAEAIAYAHARGVVHRDLKPSNVLVGELGETVVIDWGLAKDLTLPADPEVGDEPRPGGPDEMTRAGAVMGTPAYMAPEQARGIVVDERADVWALGAMLYHLLAGRPPYEGASATEVVDKVRLGPPPPLAEQEPDAPPDLVAIATRAMARDPHDRYPGAAEVAADLRRFETGQLVGAHRYTTRERIGRWLRRHRAVVTMAAAAALSLLVFGAFGVRRVVRERDRAEGERLVAETQRRAAEDLVEFMLSDLRDRLERVGRLDALEGVGDRVERYYRAIAETPGGRDAAARTRRAEALAALGDVRRTRGDLVGAVAVYEESLGLRAELSRAEPALPSLRRDVAAGQILLGDGLRAQGRLDDALASYRGALGTLTQLSADRPGELSAEARLAEAHLRIGEVERQRGELDAAVASLGQSLALRRALAERDPADAHRQLDLAASHQALGATLLERATWALRSRACRQRSPWPSAWPPRLRTTPSGSGPWRWARSGSATPSGRGAPTVPRPSPTGARSPSWSG
jgi:tetratricopeptide (TPR) repeat protein